MATIADDVAAIVHAIDAIRAVTDRYGAEFHLHLAYPKAVASVDERPTAPVHAANAAGAADLIAAWRKRRAGE